jgi:hypothetical protein
MEIHFIILTCTVNRRLHKERQGLTTSYVDFPLSSASVFLISQIFVKVGLLKKTVAAAVLLFIFTIGGFALSLAHDNALADVAFSHEPRLGLANRGWQLASESYPLRLCIESVIGTGSSLIQSVGDGTRPIGTVPPVRRLSSIYSRAYARKISLHMLDSVLLI